MSWRREIWKQASKEKYITIRMYKSLGDLLVLTMIIQELKESFPHFKINVECTHPEVFKNNPYLSPLFIPAFSHYVLLDTALYTDNHYDSYRTYLENDLKIKFPKERKVKFPSIFYEEDFDTPSHPYIVVMNNRRNDNNCKTAPLSLFEKVIKKHNTKKKYKVVQVGNIKDEHFILKDSINLIGKTTISQLFQVVKNSSLCIGGITSLLHISACYQIPYICIAGGREPSSFYHYDHIIKDYNTSEHIDCGSCFLHDCKNKDQNGYPNCFNLINKL